MEDRRHSLRRVSLDSDNKNRIDRFSPSKQERYSKNNESLQTLSSRRSTRNTRNSLSYEEVDSDIDDHQDKKRNRKIIIDDNDDDENDENNYDENKNYNNNDDDDDNDNHNTRYPRRSTRRYDDHTSINKKNNNSKRDHNMISSSYASNHKKTSSWRNKIQYDNEIQQENDDDNDDDDNEEDDDNNDEDEDEGPKYSFRNREITKRETMNITRLGGDGGGLKMNNPYERDRVQTRDSGGNHGRNYVDSQPRLYLGGKLPNYGRRNNSHHRYRRSSSSRRHYDSSSESSSSSHSRGKKSRRRSYSSDDDAGFNNYEAKRLDRERDSIQPINFSNNSLGGSVKDKASSKDLLRADVIPVAVDSKIDFNSVGGLEKHIHSLKEMVVLPLLYPDVFEKFDTQPPRGVLFVGPPGTGKTLTARALANSVSAGTGPGGRKVSFFMRKGADCLSKWVGEGERQLRLLFEQAKRYQPSIIFFDEIDGLAPVRSIKQDQIHASIVSTLLALMDGLDSRGQVVVIGATNRPDAIDPALRRPGRFDRELLFSLPDANARAAILNIHTEKWDPPLTQDVKSWIVNSTVGYCGADIKAFCAEAALVALRRSYPQIYNSSYRLSLDPARLVLTKGDFAVALKKVVPASHRSTSTQARPLDSFTSELLSLSLKQIEKMLESIFPLSRASTNVQIPGAVVDRRIEIAEDSESWIASLTDVQDFGVLQEAVHGINLLEPYHSICSLGTTAGRDNLATTAMYHPSSITFRPKLMIVGKKGMGQSELGSATLLLLESFPTFSLDYPSLVSDIYSHSPEQSLVIRVQEAIRAAPSVLYLPDITSWWRSASESLRMALVATIDSSPVNLPVIWVSTLVVDEEIEALIHSDTLVDTNSIEVQEDKRLVHVLSWLSNGSNQTISSIRERPGVINIELSKDSDREVFFSTFFDALPLLPAKIYAAKKKVLTSSTQSLVKSNELPSITVKPRLTRSMAKAPIELKSEIDPVNDERDKQAFRELRNFFRASLSELHKEKKCLIFWRPVDPSAVPDYYDIITSPMDLETMRMKVDDKMYPTLRHFLRDVEQIAFNAREYNPATLKDQRGRSIVHASNSIVDMIESHAYNFKKEIGYDLFKRCEEACERREIPGPLPIVAGAPMPEENRKFYLEILNLHKNLKTEEGRDNNETCEMENDTEVIGERATRSRASAEQLLDLDSLPTSRRKKSKVIDSDSVRENNEKNWMTLEDKKVEDKGSECEEKVNESEPTEINVATCSTETFIEELNELPPVDIESLHIIVSLKDSMHSANTESTRDTLNAIKYRFVKDTNNFTIYELVSVMTRLNRLTREFIRHGDWNLMINALENFSFTS